MLTLIDVGKQWYEKKQFTGLPADVAHVSSSLRLVLVDCGQKEGEMSVLMREGAAGSGSALPVAMCGSQFDPIGETLKVYYYSIVIILNGACLYHSIINFHHVSL